MKRALLVGTLCAVIAASIAAWADGLTVPFSMAATTCTNQFIRSIAAITGAGTCATVSLSADVTSTLAVANGGTGDTGSAWTTSSPTAVCGAGSPTTITVSARSKTLGKTVFYSANVVLTNIGTCSVNLSIPAGGVFTSNATMTALNVTTAVSKLVQLPVGQSSYIIYVAGPAFPGVNGDTIYVSGVFEIN